MLIIPRVFLKVKTLCEFALRRSDKTAPPLQNIFLLPVSWLIHRRRIFFAAQWADEPLQWHLSAQHLADGGRLGVRMLRRQVL